MFTHEKSYHVGMISLIKFCEMAVRSLCCSNILKYGLVKHGGSAPNWTMQGKTHVEHWNQDTNLLPHTIQHWPLAVSSCRLLKVFKPMGKKHNDLWLISNNTKYQTNDYQSSSIMALVISFDNIYILYYIILYCWYIVGCYLLLIIIGCDSR